MPEVGRVWLGLDFGERRIGVATGQPLTGTAQPLRTLRHTGDPMPDLAVIVREWRPAGVVVGLPLAADGTESPMSRAARAFAERLRAAHPDLRVVMHDERFSSREADARFRAARRDGRARRRDAAELDSHAAAVILESWLAETAGASA
ncbi:Holliday junction resolvase RuvX [Wenzhouxiangella sp. XN79A]|uniref:Holliday junction resolvase RuvX n=1 Tax=Wenzhouxiangella sp. XN79A TaxID=2724193 RepID=UPI00144AB5D2|nr:Holliday junction resolvase RuvX [Wenzhouxiangella sp. XN79A]NKI35656.1 Holliday junction resolvase RuvX [Wenzhouxiangella sp. XN79A]